MSLSNKNHRDFISKEIAGLPKLPIVSEFARYYGLPDPFNNPTELSTPDAIVDTTGDGMGDGIPDHTISPPFPIPTPTSAAKPARPRRASRDYSDDFERAWQAYPARAGGNPKPKAWKAWRARLRAGVEPEAMVAGVERYAAFLKATGKLGTEFVMQAATFFGPDERWKADYSTPGPSQSPKDAAREHAEAEAVRAFSQRHAGLEPVIEERRAKPAAPPLKAAGLERPSFKIPAA